MPGLLLRDGRPWRAGGPADLLIRDGVIAGIGPGLDPGDAHVLDLGGRLVLPGLVEAHCHLDKTLFGGPWRPNPPGPRRPTASPTNASAAPSSASPTRPG